MSASASHLLMRPQITRRWTAVWQRNFLVWRKLAVASVLGNIAEPLISLAAFGLGVGALIGQVNGVPYLEFLVSGSIAMSVMMAASFESQYSAFARMHGQKTWEAIMLAPVSLDNIVFAEMVWAATKSLFTAIAILIVVLVLGISHAPSLLLTLPLLVLTGAVFASMGLVMTALARGYDFFTYYFTLCLTPMMFLSGIYFPQDQLPQWLQAITQILPLAVAVKMIRPLFFNQWDSHFVWHLSILLIWGAAAFTLALHLLRRRLG